VFLGEEFPSEILRDRVALDQAREEMPAEQPHDLFAVAGRERVEAAVVRETAVGDEEVSVGMPGPRRLAYPSSRTPPIPRTSERLWHDDAAEVAGGVHCISRCGSAVEHNVRS
jgi:hypothetical protein